MLGIQDTEDKFFFTDVLHTNQTAQLLVPLKPKKCKAWARLKISI